MQMHVTTCRYCDFVVWHPRGLHTERIICNGTLMMEALAKAEHFLTLCILPELTGKWFTCSKSELPEIQVPDNDDQDEGMWKVVLLQRIERRRNGGLRQ